MTDLSKIRRYIPSAVYKQIECGAGSERSFRALRSRI